MIAGLAFAFLCLTGGVVPPATRAEVNENRAEMLVHGSGTATGSRLEPQSVRDSERYEQLLHPDPGFRAVREPKECGPTRDAPMRAECDANLGR
jgi:hypothetical protein